MFKTEQIAPRSLDDYLWKVHELAAEKGISFNRYDHLKPDKWIFQMLKLTYLLGTGKVVLRHGSYLTYLDGEEVDEKLLLYRTGERDMIGLVREWDLLKLVSAVVPPHFLNIHPTWLSGNDKTLLYAPIVEGDEVYVLELIVGLPAMVAYKRRNGTTLYDLLLQRVDWIGNEDTILAFFLRRHRLPPSSVLPGNPDFHLSAFFQVFDMPFRDWRGN